MPAINAARLLADLKHLRTFGTSWTEGGAVIRRRSDSISIQL
jgi:hypothetical protein